MLSTKSRLWLLPLTFALSACVAILPPDEKDDGVERCENSDECSDPGDNRFVALCYNDESLTQNAPGVCITDYNLDVSCDAETVINGVPEEDWPQWVAMYDVAQSNQAAYTGCEGGARGCKPAAMESCDSGLELNDDGVCHDPSSTNQTLGAALDRVGFDVQSAYCRAYFGCDEAFTCDRTIGKCVPCAPGESWENGGCQEMWVDGALATAYNNTTCNMGSTEPKDVEVGMPNQAP